MACLIGLGTDIMFIPGTLGSPCMIEVETPEIRRPAPEPVALDLILELTKNRCKSYLHRALTSFCG